MALTKVKGSGVEGITNLSNATFLSVDASEVATLLTSAVINSEGGAVTTNIAQGLAKCWVNFSYASTTAADSFNVSSLTDGAVGDFSIAINNDMVNGNFSAPCHGEAVNDWHGTETTTISGAAGTFRIIHRENNVARDAIYVGSAVHGDLA